MEDTRQNLVDHLTDLRRAILTALTALLLATAAGYYLAPTAMEIIKRPLPPMNLVFFGPFDGFYLHLRLAVILGIVLSFPAVTACLFWFVGPGMTEKERRIAPYAVVSALLLFAAGACYALLVVLPLLMSFLLSFSTPELLPFVAAEEYLTFTLSFLVYSGLAFNIPLLIVVLSVLDILSPAQITRHRRWCVASLLSLTLFFSPGGDLFTQALMALPLYLLFELAVLLAKYVVDRRINTRGDENE